MARPGRRVEIEGTPYLQEALAGPLNQGIKMEKQNTYVVIRVWPGGKWEFLAASVDVEKARFFASKHVVTDGSNYIMIQTVEVIDE